jgi:hypothetical protein
VWSGRAFWALLPITAGPGLGDAVRDWDGDIRTVAAVGLWAVWAVTFIATLVPHPVALTTWRTVAPAAAAAVALAAVGDHLVPLGALNAALAVAVAFTPPAAAAFVNGPAYPNERRFPLRPPGIALVGPAALAWVAVVGGPSAAVLLLAGHRWVAGALVTVFGGFAALDGARALHGLARRWLVVVPAGIVVHDPLTLADPVLFPRNTIAALGPADATATDRLDLTAGALGLALELRLAAPTPVFALTRSGRRPTAETVTTQRLLVAPTRPAAVLAEMVERGYAVA